MAGLTDVWMQLVRDVVQLLLNSLTFQQHRSLKRCRASKQMFKVDWWCGG